MYGVMLFVLAVGADSPGASTATATPQPPGEGRSLTAFGKDLAAALKREATAKTLAERGPAIRELVGLLTELRGDPRTGTHDLAKNFRGQLANRLARTKEDLKRQAAQDSRRPPRPSDEADEPGRLQQQDSLAATLAAADTLAGSPGLAFHRGGGAIINDNGQALVELIERTINPAFWDTNGGTGTIIYYAPLQCLVVSATGGVHHEIGGLLDGVRGAGR